MPYESNNLRDLAGVLARAFEADPLSLYLFRRHRPKKLLCFFNFILNYTDLLGDSVLTLMRTDKVVSVACLNTPKKPGNLSRNIHRLLGEMILFLIGVGPRAFIKINAYMGITSSYRPKKDHHYLVCLGTEPTFQGQGLAKELLNQIHAQVDKHPTSVGIGLDTENPNNVVFYEKFGYQLLGQKQLGSLDIYCMFRPKLGMSGI